MNDIVQKAPQKRGPIFSDWADIDSPTRAQKALVVCGFTVLGFAAGAAAAVLPGVDLHFHNMWQASLTAALASFPVSSSLVDASRRLEHRRTAGLSLLIVVLGYIAYALWFPLAVALSSLWQPQEESSWVLGAYVAVLMPKVTWKAYFLAGLVAGFVIAYVIRRLWPLSAHEIPGGYPDVPIHPA